MDTLLVALDPDLLLLENLERLLLDLGLLSSLLAFVDKDVLLEVLRRPVRKDLDMLREVLRFFLTTGELDLVLDLDFRRLERGEYDLLRSLGYAAGLVLFDLLLDLLIRMSVSLKKASKMLGFLYIKY